jgi:hypothetical protein
MEFVIPEKIFVVPYRNRSQHKFFFCNQMTFILEGQTNYEILFVHQDDERNFNRGAMKNIGFLSMKEKYPQNYKDITFIFNDVDTIPFHRIFDYDTKKGIVKHYYGFETALGGIVVIKGEDFEKVNGYPNFWGWGMEDACLQKRCLQNKIKIDRSQFYPIGSPEILQLFDGVSRLISKKDYSRMVNDSGKDGINNIHKLIYTLDEISSNPNDNIYIVSNDKIKFVNVTGFLTHVHFKNDEYFEYDLREPQKKIIHSEFNETTKKTNIQPSDWKNISYYPTLQERKIGSNQKLYLQNQYKNINKFSQEYAKNFTSKATKSVNIGLGGVKFY